MSDLIIYGASDDLIEIGGMLSDELNPPYNEPAVVTVKVDDAVYTRLHAEYDPDGTGEWRIRPSASDGTVTVIPARGEDNGSDADDCPGYSDKALVRMESIEARRVNVSIKKAE